MRGIVGLTLAGLGAFFVALALLLHFFVAGQAIKFPLNQFNQTTFSGNDVSYFYLNQLSDVTGVKVKATQFLEGDVEAGSPSTAVWEESTSIQDLTNFRTISSAARRSAFNRTTGALVNCCGEFVGSSTTVRQSGQGFVWPIGTQKQTYEVFDPTTLRPEPFRYTGTATVDGRLTYEFVEKVANQQFGTKTLPAFLIDGSGQSAVSAPEFVSETTTVWVDPGSGIPVYEVQSQTQTIQSASGVVQLVLFQGSLTETAASASAAVATAGSFDLRKQLLQDILPLVSVLLGLAMVIVGIALSGRRRGAELSGYETEVPAGLPQGYVENDYPPGLLENVFPQRLGAAGNPSAPPRSGTRWLPEAGYQQGQAAEAASWPGYSGNGYQAEQPETGPLALPANGYQQEQFQQGQFQQGQFQQPDYQSGQFQQPDYQSGQFQQPDYQSGQFQQPNHQSQVPQNGYQPGHAQDNGYWTGFPENGYPAEPPETDYPTGPPQDVYQTEQFPEVNVTPEIPGRGSDGVPWVLEPRPEQPRVGRHSRSGRDGAPGW